MGRDTPSFEQALIDAMREDPDVLMVGEMRDPETMRLTLNAAETGHLVLATAHSASVAEALQRVVAAFPAEVQNGICAQLADCLVAVICQRLQFRPDLKIQVPECEILMPGHAAKSFIRRGEFFKLVTTMETGADQGMWTFNRYRNWMDTRKNWHIPGLHGEEEPVGEMPIMDEVKSVPPPMAPMVTHAEPSAKPAKTPTTSTSTPGKGRLEIEPEEGGLEAIITKLKTKT